MSPYALAFFIGLFGSVHCMGMCGPLAFAIPAGGNKLLLILDKVLYNLGRVCTYSLLGLLFGMLGHQLWVLGLQRTISFVSGGLVILAALSRLYKIHFASNNFKSALFGPANKLLVYALQHRWGNFAVGCINGLLPCGFVYLALAGAVNASSPSQGALFMLFFGLGTFPLMLIAMVGAGFIGPPLRKRINAIIPYFMICLGLWFILRGMDLDIPYLSPAIGGQFNSICH